MPNAIAQQPKQEQTERSYIAIDLKSFYASVECVDRGLDPLTTNLVVADTSRTEKTICLAVSPSLKSYGIGGRARLFEVVQKVKEINYVRQSNAGWRTTGKTYDDTQLKAHPELLLDYIAATPRMSHYIEVSTKVYQTYLKYIAAEDKFQKILENQAVIKQPIVRNGKQATIGYRPEVWKLWINIPEGGK